MKKLTILTVLLLVTLVAWSQSTLSSMGIDPSALGSLDLNSLLGQVDMSNASVNLQGPVDLYITGVKFKGKTYAAILKYDGMGNFTVVIPSAKEMETAKYDSLDVSNVDVVLPKTLGGVITLKGIVVDGYVVSADVALDTTKVASGNVVFSAVAPVTVTAMADTHPQALQAAAMAAKEKNAQLKDYIEKVAALQKKLDASEAALAEAQKNAVPVDEGSAAAELLALRKKYADGEKMYYELTDKYDSGYVQYMEMQEKYAAGEKIYNEMKAKYDAGVIEYNSMKAKLAAAEAKLGGAMPMVSMEGASTLFVDLTSLQKFGTWTETKTGIDMTDAGAAYAKIAAQMTQAKKEIFYNFTVDANSTLGWIGAGAHILASNVGSVSRYAFGKSYLVWLTKDLRTQTDATFIQLYESISDGRMVQLASKAIDGDINSANDVSVYVNKDTDMIVISVNGEEMISYKSAKDLPDGQIAALRAAGGPVSFSGLSVKAK